MTDETQGESPVEDAPVLPVEAADSSPAPEAQPETEPTETVEQPRDEEGKFLSPKVQKRIDHLTWEKNEREREAEYWKQQALQSQQQPAKEPEVGAEPTLEACGYDEAKFKAEWKRWNDASTKALVSTELRAAKEAERAAARERAFADRLGAFAKQKPEVTALLNDKYLPVSPAMVEVIKDSEIGPELLHWIGENRQAAAAIYDLPPHLAAKELGRIEARLEFQKEAKRAPPVTKAPPPPPKVEDVETPLVNVKASEPESDKLSDAEWMRLRAKETKRKKA